MNFSPPIVVPAVLAVGIAAAALFSPLQHAPTRVTVSLSAATHSALVSWAKGNLRRDGRIPTAERAIEALVRNEIDGHKR